MSAEKFLSAGARAMRSSLIRQLTGLVNRPDVISFAAGSPNAATFPHERFTEIYNDLAARERGRIFQYSVTRGNAQLIHAVCGRSREIKSITASPEETILLSGSQQGLDFVGRVLLDPGDAVFVEMPSFIGATAAFANLGARLFGVNCDEDGMDIDHLARQAASARKQGLTPKFAYVIPNFQNPSGRVWSPARRRELYALAARENFLVFEDDAYGELYFDDAAPADLLPVKALDEDDRVIYMSTFSKILAPGLRVAWIHGPEAIVRRIEFCKETGDLCTATLSQRIVLEFLRRGEMPAQTDRVRAFYTGKAAKMRAAAAAHFDGLAQWTRPRGGLFLWLRLFAAIDTLPLLRESVERDKVAFIPGAPFFVDGSGSNALRLSFSNVSDENIEIGISRLSRRVRERRP